jgi:hypothetical protein
LERGRIRKRKRKDYERERIRKKAEFGKRKD